MCIMHVPRGSRIVRSTLWARVNVETSEKRPARRGGKALKKSGLASAKLVRNAPTLPFCVCTSLVCIPAATCTVPGARCSYAGATSSQRPLCFPRGRFVVSSTARHFDAAVRSVTRPRSGNLEPSRPAAAPSCASKGRERAGRDGIWLSPTRPVSEPVLERLADRDQSRQARARRFARVRSSGFGLGLGRRHARVGRFHGDVAAAA